MTDSFCPIPWTSVIVRADGRVQTCNRHAGRLHDGRRELHLLRDRPDALWNGTELAGLRAALAAGEQPPLCRECWHAEATGARSLRRSKTDDWLAGHLNPDGQSPAEVIATGRPGPSSVQLDIGNRCNLACRMCNAGASSRIDRDPVHSAWTGAGSPEGRPLEPWFGRPGGVDRAMALLADASQVHVIGGEPALIPEVDRLLERLVADGLAPRLELSLHTNATVVRTAWLPLLARFRKVVFYVSLDGTGDVYEYVRHPARWPRVAANVERLSAVEHVEVRAHVVVQNLNVVRLTELFRWLDDRAIPYEPHLLDAPSRLRPTVLPAAARAQAADRLDAYRAGRTDPTLVGIATTLREAPPASPALLRSFMEFTNDLDVTRHQSFATVHPDLVAMLAEEGHQWLPATRFAHRAGAHR